MSNACEGGSIKLDNSLCCYSCFNSTDLTGLFKFSFIHVIECLVYGLISLFFFFFPEQSKGYEHPCCPTEHLADCCKTSNMMPCNSSLKLGRTLVASYGDLKYKPFCTNPLNTTSCEAGFYRDRHGISRQCPEGMLMQFIFPTGHLIDKTEHQYPKFLLQYLPVLVPAAIILLRQCYNWTLSKICTQNRESLKADAVKETLLTNIC